MSLKPPALIVYTGVVHFHLHNLQCCSADNTTSLGACGAQSNTPLRWYCISITRAYSIPAAHVHHIHHTQPTMTILLHTTHDGDETAPICLHGLATIKHPSSIYMCHLSQCHCAIYCTQHIHMNVFYTQH